MPVSRKYLFFRETLRTAFPARRAYGYHGNAADFRSTHRPLRAVRNRRPTYRQQSRRAVRLSRGDSEPFAHFMKQAQACPSKARLEAARVCSKNGSVPADPAFRSVSVASIGSTTFSAKIESNITAAHSKRVYRSFFCAPARDVCAKRESLVSRGTLIEDDTHCHRYG